MTHRMIYLTGAPGSGKSTLMAKLTEHLHREEMHACTGEGVNSVSHDVLYFKHLDSVVDGKVVQGAIDGIAGAEIGLRRPQFGGTDALPASVIEKAIPWVEGKPYELLLAEGARLANKRFLTAAAKAGYEVHLCLLDHPDVEQWRAQRSVDLGRVQNASWVQGRYTASVNLAKHFAGKPDLGVKVYIGHPDRIQEDIEHLLG